MATAWVILFHYGRRVHFAKAVGDILLAWDKWEGSVWGEGGIIFLHFWSLVGVYVNQFWGLIVISQMVVDLDRHPIMENKKTKEHLESHAKKKKKKFRNIPPRDRHSARVQDGAPPPGRVHSDEKPSRQTTTNTEWTRPGPSPGSLMNCTSALMGCRRGCFHQAFVTGGGGALPQTFITGGGSDSHDGRKGYKNTLKETEGEVERSRKSDAEEAECRCPNKQGQPIHQWVLYVYY